MPAREAEERSVHSQIAALEKWLKEPDRTAATAKAREAAADALTAKLAQQVDPDGSLDPADHARRVQTARKLHFARMAAKSHRARRARQLADQLDAEIRDALLPLVASPDAAADAA